MESFLREFHEYVSWEKISTRMRFPENYDYDFYEDFKDRLDFKKISKMSNMDELFIIKFSEELDWDVISGIQGLTRSLVEIFHNKINWDAFRRNYHISTVLKEELTNEFNPEEIEEEGEIEEDTGDEMDMIDN